MTTRGHPLDPATLGHRGPQGCVMIRELPIGAFAFDSLADMAADLADLLAGRAVTLLPSAASWAGAAFACVGVHAGPAPGDWIATVIFPGNLRDDLAEAIRQAADPAAPRGFKLEAA